MLWESFFERLGSFLLEASDLLLNDCWLARPNFQGGDGVTFTNLRETAEEAAVEAMVEEADEGATEDTAEETAEEAFDETAEGATEDAADDIAEEAVEETAEEAAEDAFEETAEDAAEEAATDDAPTTELAFETADTTEEAVCSVHFPLLFLFLQYSTMMITRRTTAASPPHPAPMYTESLLLWKSKVHNLGIRFGPWHHLKKSLLMVELSISGAHSRKAVNSDWPHCSHRQVKVSWATQQEMVDWLP